MRSWSRAGLSALTFPSGTVFKYPSEGVLTRPPQTVASISAGKHRAKAVVDIRGDEGRSGSRRSANGVHHPGPAPGVTARAEGIRCARLSREKGTAVLALCGELWGASPPAATAEHQRRHRSHISGNGNLSAVRPRRLSCAARSRAFVQCLSLTWLPLWSNTACPRPVTACCQKVVLGVFCVRVVRL